MVPGVGELSGLFIVLEHLEVVDDGIDIGNAANYAIAYSPDEVRINLSGEYVEEEATDEEADIMFMCEHVVEAWMNQMDDILLEEDNDS